VLALLIIRAILLALLLPMPAIAVKPHSLARCQVEIGIPVAKCPQRLTMPLDTRCAVEALPPICVNLCFIRG